MELRIADQFTGDFGIYNLDTMAEELDCHGTTAEESKAHHDLAAALKAEDWIAVADIAGKLHIDVEFV